MPVKRIRCKVYIYYFFLLIKSETFVPFFSEKGLIYTCQEKIEKQLTNLFLKYIMDSILSMLIKKSITSNSTIIISNKNFMINYSRNLGRPLFVSYDVFPNQISQLGFGRKKFSRDIRLDFENIYQLEPASQIFSGQMSRGHLCPSFIMSHDKSKFGSWESTYLMSNIIPQNRDFNCGAWRKLEIDTFNFIKKVSNHVRVIVGASNIDYSSKVEYSFANSYNKFKIHDNKKIIIWQDQNTGFEYKIPNVMYKIIITNHEVKCYIGLNNSNQQIYSIDLNNLFSLI